MTTRADEPKQYELKEAREILDDYKEPCGHIDIGNVYFAATQFEGAYDSAIAELAEVKKVAFQAQEMAKEIAVVNDTYKAALEIADRVMSKIVGKHKIKGELCICTNCVSFREIKALIGGGE